MVDKYGLRKYVKLRYQVEYAEWNEETGKWTITVTNLDDGIRFEDQSDFFINCSGIFKYGYSASSNLLYWRYLHANSMILSYWQWPNIKGLKSYKGVLVYSAAYPESLDLSGKRIAIVGIGASGL